MPYIEKLKTVNPTFIRSHYAEQNWKIWYVQQTFGADLIKQKKIATVT